MSGYRAVWWEVYHALDPGREVLAPELQDRLGIERQTVHRALTLLARAGVVRRVQVTHQVAWIREAWPGEGVRISDLMAKGISAREAQSLLRSLEEAGYLEHADGVYRHREG